MKLGIIANGIIALLSASSLPEVKLGDIEIGELYDMFLPFRPCTHGKRDVRGALAAKKQLPPYSS